jgi:methionine-rich copper-binding protein CopC
MDISMLKEYHNCSDKSVDEEDEDKCQQEFFKQFLESNFGLIQSELIKNEKKLNLVKSMYAESIAQANGALQAYEEKQVKAGNEFPELSALEANDKLESIFNEVKNNKQQGGKKKSKKRTTKKSKKRTKIGGKKRTTKKNKKRTTKKSKKRTTKKRK